MTEQHLRFPTVLFDWGDTVMRDDPKQAAPMVEWKTVEVIDGIADVLAYLHASGRQIALATSADVSTEAQIHGALARADLDQYFSRIYSFRTTNLVKSEAFYRFVLNDLGICAPDAVMVGDHFEKDVQMPNSLGIFAVWFNPRSEITSSNELHISIHSMLEVGAFFKSLDQE